MSDDICPQCGISVRKYTDLYHTGGPRGACEVALFRDNADLRLQLDAAGIEDMRNEIAFLRDGRDVAVSLCESFGNEITALRAALDQERADNAQLRQFANATWQEYRAAARMCGLLDLAGNPSALLSGRGDDRP